MKRVGVVLGAVGFSLAASLGAAGQASAVASSEPGYSFRDYIGTVGIQFSFATQWLNAGGSWSFGNVHLDMQSDGNLVIYKNSNHQYVWKSDTYGSGATKMLFRHDGNLVLQKANGTVVWQSNTANKCPAVHDSVWPVLALQDDSNFVLYCYDAMVQTRSPYKVMWAAGTNGA
jgi:hypothetical protein